MNLFSWIGKKKNFNETSFCIFADKRRNSQKITHAKDNFAKIALLEN